MTAQATAKGGSRRAVSSVANQGRLGTVILQLALVLVFLGLVYGLTRLASDAQRFPVRSVKVDGHIPHVDRQGLQAIVLPHTDQSFFMIDLATLRREVQAFPWIRQVSMRRVWPDTVYLHITEHEPAARWNVRAVVSRSGVVFEPNDTEVVVGPTELRATTGTGVPELAGVEPVAKRPGITRVADSIHVPTTTHTVSRPVSRTPELSELPSLSGPRGHATQVLAQYHLFRAALTGTGLGIAELVLDERRSWSMLLTNNLRLRLGRRQVRARLDRFVQAFHSFIKPQLGRIESVDLRYTNGFAVAWKKPSPA